jgi:hypothetical protein
LLAIAVTLDNSGLKPDPFNTALVPPKLVPLLGVTVLTTGAGIKYLNPLASVPCIASELTTLTVTAPIVTYGGTVAVSVVSFTNVVLADWAVPNHTLAPLSKLAPVTVTLSPPLLAALAGATPLIVGAVPAA